jgi:hypothetical protein
MELPKPFVDKPDENETKPHPHFFPIDEYLKLEVKDEK